MRNETKLPELVSVASATPVCSALYTSFDGIDTMEAPAACHIEANVGPAERTLSPLMSSGLRIQPRLEAIAPASQASASTTTPALSICALMSFMYAEDFMPSPLPMPRTCPLHTIPHK